MTLVELANFVNKFETICVNSDMFGNSDDP